MREWRRLRVAFKRFVLLVHERIRGRALRDRKAESVRTRLLRHTRPLLSDQQLQVSELFSRLFFTLLVLLLATIPAHVMRDMEVRLFWL